MSPAFLAHDIINKVTILDILLETLERKVLKGAISPQEVLDFIHNCQNVCADITDYCKDGLNPNRERELDIKKIMGDLQKQYDSAQFGLVIDEKDPLVVLSSKVLLKRVFENIIKNARDNKATQMEISISKNRVLFVDDGSGVTPEILIKLRVGEAVSTKEKGGVGLQFVRQTCKEKGWQLKFDSVTNMRDLSKKGLAVQITFKPPATPQNGQKSQ